MLLFLVIGIFIAGQVVGRTSEYLRRKIGGREMKLAMIALLVHPILILGGHHRDRADLAARENAPSGVRGHAHGEPRQLPDRGADGRFGHRRLALTSVVLSACPGL